MSRSPPNPVFTLKGTMKPVHSLMFDLNEEEERIYAGTQEGKIHVWDLKNYKEVVTYSIGNETCLAMHQLKSSNRLLITQEKNGKYKFWSENQMKNELSLEREFDSNYYGFCRSILTEDNRYIVCPCNNASINLVATETAGDDVLLKKSTNKTLGEIMIIKLIKEFMFVVYEAGVIEVWSLDTKQCLNNVELISDCPMAFDVSDNKSSANKIFGYVGSNSEVIQELVIETHDNVSVRKKRELRLTNAGVSNISIRPDNKLFVVSCWDKRLRLFSCKSLKLLVVLDFHKDVIQDILFSNTSVGYWNCRNLLAAGSTDGRVSLWDLY